jgi:hypothetical protein
MAKKDMLCPFSGDLCKECPQYRGRHYYLCFSSKYRGYLASEEKPTGTIVQSRTPGKRFEIPAPLKPSPTWLAFNDYLERKGK